MPSSSFAPPSQGRLRRKTLTQNDPAFRDQIKMRSMLSRMLANISDLDPDRSRFERATMPTTYCMPRDRWRPVFRLRSEEHTSELQSLMRISYAVFCLTQKLKIINNQLYL